MRAARDLERQYASLSQENVALEAAALVLRAYLIDYAGDAYLIRARNLRLHEHDVVELQELIGLDRDPPIERC